jgi:hypothetical protein
MHGNMNVKFTKSVSEYRVHIKLDTVHRLT